MPSVEKMLNNILTTNSTSWRESLIYFVQLTPDCFSEVIVGPGSRHIIISASVKQARKKYEPRLSLGPGLSLDDSSLALPHLDLVEYRDIEDFEALQVRLPILLLLILILTSSNPAVVGLRALRRLPHPLRPQRRRSPLRSLRRPEVGKSLRPQHELRPSVAGGFQLQTGRRPHAA